MEIIDGLKFIQELEINLLITAFWFPIYWIFGGVFFATITFLRVIKLRKVRFSCLFTITSLLTAFGAAYLGMFLGEKEITACLTDVEGFVNFLSAVIGCGIFSFFLAGIAGFIILLLLGMIILMLSRAANQSWVDSDVGVREERNLMFDME